MNDKSTSFTVLGSNSGRNAGDAAILGAILGLLSKEFGPETKFEVPTTNPSFVTDTYGKSYNVTPVGAMPWHFSVRLLGVPTFRSIKRTDAILITDGIIFDVGLFNPLFNFLITLIFLVPWAKFCGKKVVCFNVGIGPLRTFWGRKFAKFVGDKSDLITVRDMDSLNLFREIGVTKQIEMTADSVFAGWAESDERTNEILSKHNLLEQTREGKVIGINVTKYVDRWLDKNQKVEEKQSFLPILAKSLTKLRRDLDITPVIVVTQVMDQQFAERLQSYVFDYFAGPNGDDFCPEIISNVDYTNHEIMGICSRFSMLVGMRLHSLIIAAQANTPVVGMVYAPKVKSFLKQLDTPEFAIELSGLGDVELSNRLIDAWTGREELYRTQNKVVDKLRAGANRAAYLLSQLLGKEKVVQPKAATSRA